MDRARLVPFVGIVVVVFLVVALVIVDGHLRKSSDDQRVPLKMQLPAAFLTIVAVGLFINWSGLI